MNLGEALKAWMLGKQGMLYSDYANQQEQMELKRQQAQMQQQQFDMQQQEFSAARQDREEKRQKEKTREDYYRGLSTDETLPEDYRKQIIADLMAGKTTALTPEQYALDNEARLADLDYKRAQTGNIQADNERQQKMLEMQQQAFQATRDDKAAAAKAQEDRQRMAQERMASFMGVMPPNADPQYKSLMEYNMSEGKPLMTYDQYAAGLPRDKQAFTPLQRVEFNTKALESSVLAGIGGSKANAESKLNMLERAYLDASKNPMAKQLLPEIEKNLAASRAEVEVLTEQEATAKALVNQMAANPDLMASMTPEQIVSVADTISLRIMSEEKKQSGVLKQTKANFDSAVSNLPLKDRARMVSIINDRANRRAAAEGISLVQAEAMEYAAQTKALQQPSAAKDPITEAVESGKKAAEGLTATDIAKLKNILAKEADPAATGRYTPPNQQPNRVKDLQGVSWEQVNPAVNMDPSSYSDEMLKGFLRVR